MIQESQTVETATSSEVQRKTSSGTANTKRHKIEASAKVSNNAKTLAQSSEVRETVSEVSLVCTTATV